MRDWNIFIAVAVLCFIPASRLAAENYPPAESTVILSEIAGISSLDPLKTDPAHATIALRLLFDSLLIRGRDGDLSAGLAESWETENEGRVWTFHLRKGIRFHDGFELTADDVLFTFSAVRDLFCPQLYSLSDSADFSCEKLDRYTVRLTKDKPGVPVFLIRLPIVPVHLIGTNGDRNADFEFRPVGTGSYRFVESLPDRVILTANRRYFRGAPPIEYVVIRRFSDPQSAWAALMQGEVDVVNNLDEADYLLLKGDPRFEVHHHRSTFLYSILLNTQNPLFSDPAIREVLNYAIDRDDLLREVLGGSGKTAPGPAASESCENAFLNLPEYRPDKAAAALDRMGWVDTDNDLIRERDGEDLCVKLLLEPGDPVELRAAKRIRWQLLQLGVRLEIEIAGENDILKEYIMPLRFQAALLQTDDSIAVQRICALLNPDSSAVFLFYQDTFTGYSRNILGVNPDYRLLYDAVYEWEFAGGRNE